MQNDNVVYGYAVPRLWFRFKDRFSSKCT